MPRVMRRHRPILLRHQQWYRRHQWHRRFLCHLLQLGAQRDRISNHHSLWFWWWQMNQDSPAGLQYRRLGTSLEANFQGITWMNSGWAAFIMLVDFTEGCQMDFFQSEIGVKKSEGCPVPWSGITAVYELRRAARWINLGLCLTEAASWVCVARRIGFIASRFTLLSPRVQSRAAGSQKEWIANHLNLIASHLNWIAHHLNLNASVVFHLLVLCCLMYTFSVQKPSKKQQKLSVQSCLQKLCRELLSEDPVLFAEAVRLSCRSCALVL